MFSPKLYRVNKIPLKHIMAADFNIIVDREENNKYTVLQQDNMLFRQIRLITNDISGIYLPYIIFVNANGCQDSMNQIISNGFYFNNRRYVISERSASMVRQSILSFVDERISAALDEVVTMGLQIDKTVLAKWYAYRGLMLSSCHCLENWKPKIIIVPDKYAVIKEQRIKYLVDSEVDFVDKDGNQRTWKQKDIAEAVKDVEINLFDGCGVYHPDIAEQITELLHIRPTSVLIRAPFIKGMIHEFDYTKFFLERGVALIQDIWGSWHDVQTAAIIMSESMYKGYKYFKHYGDQRDWESYWEAFDRYNHCIGIVKWNRNLEEEEVYRRGNYQILQDLELDYYHFKHLADDSAEWVENIIGGDWRHTACFLGLFADRCSAVVPYTKALVKNPMMINEVGVRNYLVRSLKKYIDEMKCGKVYLKATSKYLAPDLIMFMEHVGGLKLEGCLAAEQFWTQNMQGDYEGEFLIERNPHLAKSEHGLLKGVKNELIDRYLSHLHNVCMVNSKSLIAQRLNGADMDKIFVPLFSNE